MRLDKFLADMGLGSRKEVRQFIRQKRVVVNGTVVTVDKFQVKEKKDEVLFDKKAIIYQKYFYYMLNKPAGVITATMDNYEKTVLDLFTAEDFRRDLFPVGRLDKDTEGLLLITNDGKLSHRLLSPRYHVEKEYWAKVTGVMNEKDSQLVAAGLKIDQGEICQPAQLTIEKIDSEKQTSVIRLVLHEGKFHQVKRMIHALGKEVTYLKRVRMADLKIDPELSLGNYREMTEKEVTLLLLNK
ncbi:MAG TPA: pseudouridine synthase [Tetragenococcus sp.]|nr:pseudouridine synthase [Tetragenococcus sp.]